MTAAASPTDLPSATDGYAAPPAAALPPRRAFVEQIMGLPISVHVRGPQAAGSAVRRAVDAAFAVLRADDAEFSTYRPDSAVSRIRRGELSTSQAGPRMREVVALCHEAAARTQGAFSAWAARGGDARFDPSGLVKGWSAQRAFEQLRADLERLGAHDALLSAGGDVVLACSRTDTPDWTVAVEDPVDLSRVLTTIPLRAGAVATSGTAARGQHVIDPRTGTPATALLSATVVGPGLMWADVYATALLACGGDAPWFASIAADHAAILVDAGGATQILP